MSLIKSFLGISTFFIFLLLLIFLFNYKQERKISVVVLDMENQIVETYIIDCDEKDSLLFSSKELEEFCIED
jgi:hypothetical protein